MTWFNLPLITSEIGERWYPGRRSAGPVHSSAVRKTGASRWPALSRARALAPVSELGMFLAPEPRLVLHRRSALWRCVFAFGRAARDGRRLGRGGRRTSENIGMT
jgi:hypothetical protein